MTVINVRNYRLSLVTGICLLMSLASCQAVNEEFCETSSDCSGTDVCTGNVCVVSSLADASPSVAEPDSTKSPDAGATDAVCPTETHQCLPGPPEGWTGPSIRADGQFGATPPACPSGFNSPVIGFRELSAGGSCGCSCGGPENVTCTSAAIEGRDGAIDFSTCFAACTGDYCSRQTIHENDGCAAISSAVSARDNLRWEPSIVNGGSCSAGTPSNNLVEPSFTAQTSLCTLTEVQDGCSQGNLCAPKAPQEFDAQTCIFQEGEHECPSNSIYSERLITYTSYVDQRSCDSCDCTFKANGNCGFIEFFNDDANCSEEPYEQGVCTAQPTLIAGRVKFTRDVQASCDATPNPSASGDAVGIGATTVCCSTP